MKTHTLRIFLLLVALLPSVVHAEKPSEQPKTKEAPLKKAAPSLTELSASKRPAVIKLTLKSGPNKGQPFFGAFISADGLALVCVSSLAYKDAPAVSTHDGSSLTFGSVLGIFPAPELALMKFNHRPKVWLELAQKEPGIGDRLAMVFAPKSVSGQSHETPPVVGPVMARRSSMLSANIQQKGFQTILSLGSGLSPTQSNSFAPGVFAINAKGELVAVSGGIQPVDRHQSHIILPLITHLFDEIGQLAKAHKPIPRVEAKKHVKTTFVDNDYRSMNLALIQGDHAKAKTHLKKLIKRHPNDSTLKKMAMGYDLRDKNDKPYFTLEDFQPDPKSSKAEQASILMDRARLLMKKNDSEAAIKTLEQARELCPKDFPNPDVMIAHIHLQARHLDKARLQLEKIYPLMTDSIGITGVLKGILTQQKKMDQVDLLVIRLRKLKAIYKK